MTKKTHTNKKLSNKTLALSKNPDKSAKMYKLIWGFSHVAYALLCILMHLLEYYQLYSHSLKLYSFFYEGWSTNNRTYFMTFNQHLSNLSLKFLVCGNAIGKVLLFLDHPSYSSLPQLHSEWPKLKWSFGHSECNRVRRTNEANFGILETLFHIST